MPMIDVYATTGTFHDTHTLARDLATAVMTVEGVPDIPMFRDNTAAFIHDLPATSISNVNGDSTYVRVQVLTNAGALDRDKQLAVVARLTSIVADAAGDPRSPIARGSCSPRRLRVAGACAGTPARTRSSSRRPGLRSLSSVRPGPRADDATIKSRGTVRARRGLPLRLRIR